MYDRDFDYDYFGYKTLERSYLLRVDGKIVERPQHLLMRVAIGIHKDVERAIDTYEKAPPPLTSFVLPGGSEGAARFHLGRCICRRAERSLVALGAHESIRGELFRYLNRLSDLLFVLARYANHEAGVEDIPWVGQGG